MTILTLNGPICLFWEFFRPLEGPVQLGFLSKSFPCRVYTLNYTSGSENLGSISLFWCACLRQIADNNLLLGIKNSPFNTRLLVSKFCNFVLTNERRVWKCLETRFKQIFSQDRVHWAQEGQKSQKFRKFSQSSTKNGPEFDPPKSHSDLSEILNMLKRLIRLNQHNLLLLARKHH